MMAFEPFGTLDKRIKWKTETSPCQAKLYKTLQVGRMSPLFFFLINTPDINVPPIVLPSKTYFYWTEPLTTWAGTPYTYWWTQAEVLSIHLSYIRILGFHTYLSMRKYVHSMYSIFHVSCLQTACSICRVLGCRWGKTPWMDATPLHPSTFIIK